jgi:hypothetical protein
VQPNSSINEKSFPSELVLQKMPEVLNWLKSFGFKSLCTRYSRYIKYIDTFFTVNNPDSEEGRLAFELLIKSYNECLEIVIIKTVFKEEKSNGFKTRLGKVITGRDHLNNAAISESRDYLFELLVAARFSRAGYKVDFDFLTDIVARKEELIVYSECKRITSEKRFKENFDTAGKQLEREMKKTSDSKLGLIFIDVSSILSKGIQKIEVNDELVAKRILGVAMKQFIAQHAHDIESLNSKHIGHSLGVCLLGRSSMWTKDFTLYTVTNLDVRASEQLSNSKFSNLEKVLHKFDSAFDDLLCGNLEKPYNRSNELRE